MLKDGEMGVVVQRDQQTYGIAPHIPCGVVSPDVLRKIADVAEKYKIPMVKITSAARIALLGIREEDVEPIWAELGMEFGSFDGVCVRNIKACPGTDYCRWGKQDSLGVGLKLDEKYHGLELPGKVKIGVSGCTNQCGETGFKDIGLVGTPKGWRLLVGGVGGAVPRIGEVIAQRLDTDEAIALLDRILQYYRANARPNERIGRLIARLGLTDMEDAVGL